MKQRIIDWLREFVTDRPRRPLAYGLIAIDQEQMRDMVKDKPVLISDADGGWNIQGLAREIFVPYNQVFKFPGRDTIFVQRSSQLEVVLDRMEAGFPDQV